MSEPPEPPRAARRRSRLSPATWRLIDRSAVALVLTLPTAGLVIATTSALRGDLPELSNAIVFFVLWVSTLFGIEAGYHRYFSHASFRTGPAFEVTLALLGSMAFQGPVVWWAAMHRRHHRHADDDRDPHSPQLRGGGFSGITRGLWGAHFAWLFDEVDSISRKSSWADLVPDLIANRRVWWVHRRYPLWLFLGIALPAALGWALTGTGHGAWMGLLWGGFVRIFLVNHAIWAVNSVCHLYGRRPFALHTRDHSTNNAWVAAVSLGAGWHHNHHVFPGSATTQIEWWQIDGSGLMLSALTRLGITWELRGPPPGARNGAWSRQVFAQVRATDGGEHRARLGGLHSQGVFIETPLRAAVGSRLELHDLCVRDRRGEPLRTVDVPPIEAVVDRIGPRGLRVTFPSLEPRARAMIAELRQRRVAE